IRSISLRYFNAAGADPEGQIGEDHNPETHLIPLVLSAASGGDPITVYGTDYETPDGTCIRDFIHVSDLADAHVFALKALQKQCNRPSYNLGTGNGYSVRQVIKAAEAVTGQKVRVKEGPRRPGDPPRLVADASRAREEVGWKTRYSGLADHRHSLELDVGTPGCWPNKRRFLGAIDSLHHYLWHLSRVLVREHLHDWSGLCRARLRCLFLRVRLEGCLHRQRCRPDRAATAWVGPDLRAASRRVARAQSVQWAHQLLDRACAGGRRSGPRLPCRGHADAKRRRPCRSFLRVPGCRGACPTPRWLYRNRNEVDRAGGDQPGDRAAPQAASPRR